MQQHAFLAFWNPGTAAPQTGRPLSGAARGPSSGRFAACSQAARVVGGLLRAQHRPPTVTLHRDCQANRRAGRQSPEGPAQAQSQRDAHQEARSGRSPSTGPCSVGLRAKRGDRRMASYAPAWRTFWPRRPCVGVAFPPPAQGLTPKYARRWLRPASASIVGLELRASPHHATVSQLDERLPAAAVCANQAAHILLSVRSRLCRPCSQRGVLGGGNGEGLECVRGLEGIEAGVASGMVTESHQCCHVWPSRGARRADDPGAPSGPQDQGPTLPPVRMGIVVSVARALSCGIPRQPLLHPSESVPRSPRYGCCAGQGCTRFRAFSGACSRRGIR